MKRYLMMLLVVVFTITLFMSLRVEASLQYTWKMALEEIEGSVQDAWAQEFKRRIEERSNGEIRIDVFPYGTVGTGMGDLAEAAQYGIMEFAFTSPAVIAGIIPEGRVFSLHYLWPEDLLLVNQVLAESEAIDVLRDCFERQNLHLLSIFTEGWQVWTTNNPVRTPEEMSGLRMRVMPDPILMDNYRAYGADPIQLAYAEVYSALQLGMIDAQVNPIFAIEEMRFYEQTDYLIWGYTVPYVGGISANMDFFQGLPQEYQEMILEVVDELVDYIYQVQEDFNDGRLELILERKPQIEMIHLTAEEREAFRELAMPVWDKYVDDTGATGRQILELLQKDIEKVQ